MKSLALLAIALSLVTPPVSTVPAAPDRSLGDARFANGDFPGATAAYRVAVRAAPGDVDANVGLATLALYGNRYDEARRYARTAHASDPANAVAARLLAAIAHHADNLATYRLPTHAAEIDLPFVQTDPLPVVVVRIDGKRARLVLDTGGPGLTLSKAFAAEAGVVASVPERSVFAGGKTAMTRSGGLVASFVAAGVTIRDVPANVAPVPDASIDGVLGTGFFTRFLTTIDYTGGRLVLRPASDSTAFEAESVRSGASIEPLYLVPDHFLLTSARVNDGPEALFTIDTGGAGIGVDLTAGALAAAHVPTAGGHDVMLMGGGGPVRARAFTAGSVSFGMTTVRDVPGISIPGAGGGSPFPFVSAGRLSHAFFRHTRLTLDFVAMRAIVSTP